MSDPRLHGRLRARSPRSVLRSLLAPPPGEGEPPHVTLHLASGRELGGWLLDADLASGFPSVLLQPLLEDPPGPRPHACYVELRAVVAITVHEAASHLARLGPVEAPGEGDPAPTPLALEKLLLRAREDVAYAADTELSFEVREEDLAPGEELPVRTLHAAVEATRRALLTIAREEFGRRAIAARLQRVMFRAAERTEVRVAGDSLLVDCAPDQPLPAPAALARRIEDAL